MFSSVIYLLFLACATLLIQVIGFGLILIFSQKKQLNENLWAFGRIVGWLALGLVIWFMAHFIGVNSDFGFWLVFTGFVGWLFFSKLNIISQFRFFLKKHRKIILFQELIFLLGFIFLGLVRAHNPDVLDLEKFMDAGLMQSYLTSAKLPVEDMWLAGEKVNYYTFGHFLGSLMIRFWHLPIEFGYNFLLAFILGLMMVESFALVRIFLTPFLKKKNQSLVLLITGLVGLLLVNFGGNTHPIWYFIQHNFSFDKYWYPDATRFIDRTIHEFPAYSYIVSDLHAHVWGMPVVLLMMLVCWRWMETMQQAKLSKKLAWTNLISQQWLKEAAVLGVLLGVLAMTSTWDMMIYGLLLVVLGFSLLILFTEKFWLFFMAGIVAVVFAGVTVSLWWLNFTSISEGVFLAYEHSPLWQLLALWSGHFGLSLIGVGLVYLIFKDQQKNPQKIFIASLLITALILLILPEVIFFKDIYPNHPRANTMFKFTFQAFIIMSFLVAFGLGLLTQITNKTSLAKLIKTLLLSLFLLVIIGFMTYPFLGYPSYYGEFKNYKGWNGLDWMKKSYPADYQAILWLRQLNDKAIVLEAVGESYSKKARVSVFTGLPTVLGWRVHEWLWRGGFTIPGQRTTEVKTMFEQPLSAEAQALFKHYQVKYIFIGSQEREVYKSLKTNDLLTLGELVYAKDGTFIIKLN